MCYNDLFVLSEFFMKIALALLLFASSVSFANHNSTFANAINANAQEQVATPPKSELKPDIKPDLTKPKTDEKPKDDKKTDKTPKKVDEKAGEKSDKPAEVPANPHNPSNDSLLEALTPHDSELSKANTELLAKNAELTRQVDDLSTQVNVLVQERSGQLFIYGAMTGIVSMTIGFILSKILTRQRW